MKMTLKSSKPRNPFVAAALRKRAGRHAGAQPRQQAQRDLRAELHRLKASP